MHVLIVGCGYLGERAASLWRESGHRVTALTRNPDRHPEWMVLGMNIVQGDVLDRDSLKSLPAADLCLYAVGHDRTAAADKRTVYVDGLRNVLSEIRGRVPRLLFISSTSVYGQSQGEWVNEQSPCQPESEAGRICLDAEQQVREFYPEAAAGAPQSAVLLRLAGIYGPGRLIARCDQLKQGQVLSGCPDAWLNLIYVDDTVQAVKRLSECPAGRGLFLLSDETPLTRREFYEAIAARIGAPPPQFDQQGEQSLNKRCDSRIIRQELGLTLRYPQAISALDELLQRR